MRDTRKISYGNAVLPKEVRDKRTRGYIEGMGDGAMWLPELLGKYMATANMADPTPGELRDPYQGLSGVYKRYLVDKESRRAESNQDPDYNEMYNTGRTTGELVDPIGNLAALGAGGMVGKVRYLDDMGAIVMKDGKPLDMYHGSRQALQNGFTNNMLPKHDLGTHFGTLEQATNRIKHPTPLVENEMMSGANIRKNYLDFDNVVEMEDITFREPQRIYDEIEKRGLLPAEELEKLHKKLYALGDNENKRMATIRKTLLDNGIDGVMYDNTYEGRGMSYIALDPEKAIKMNTDGLSELEYLGKAKTKQEILDSIFQDFGL